MELIEQEEDGQTGVDIGWLVRRGMVRPRKRRREEVEDSPLDEAQVQDRITEEYVRILPVGGWNNPADLFTKTGKEKMEKICWRC